MIKRLLILALIFLPVAAKAQALYTYGAPQTPVPASYFGMDYIQPSIDAYPPFTIGLWRIWSTPNWGTIETSSGVYTWGSLDNILSYASSNNVTDIEFTFGYVPSWNSSAPGDATCNGPNGSCDPNASDAEFITFVNTITQRYCGVIRYWEGWNEPDGLGFWNSTTALFLTYMADEYAAVHSTANCACNGATCSPGQPGGTNPNKVVLPTAHNLGGFAVGQHQEFPFMSAFLAGGGGSYIDIASLHSYQGTPSGYANPELYVPDAVSFRQLLRDNNQQTKPIWNTEMDWGPSTSFTSTQQNSWIARLNLMHWAMGFQRAIWFVYTSSGTANQYGKINPASAQATAYQYTQKWMVGAVEKNCIQYVNSDWICNFSRTSPAGYKAYAVWNSTGTGSYTVPTGVIQYRNVLNNITATSGGNVIATTDSPLLFETVAGAF